MLKRELKINAKSLFIWITIISVFFIIIFSIYPSIIENENGKMLNEMLKAFPQGMLETFNMDIVGIDSAFGWFKTEGFMILTLIGGIYASMLGAGILLKEEGEKTIEFLNSKPVTRNKIVTSKILCGIINIFSFTVIISIVNFIALQIIGGEFDTKEYFMITLIPILLYYMLFFICLFLSTFLRKTRQGMTLALVVTFGTYLMQIIGGMSEKVKIIKDISLFEFISSRYIYMNHHLNVNYIIIGSIIIIAAMTATYIRYNRKEL